VRAQAGLKNMIDRGDLPAIRVGSRRVRVQRSDLDAFLAQGRRLTQRSPTRIDFDDALGAANKAIRSRDGASAAAALRVLSQAALLLATEIEGGS
jgi:Helix-turn-helix domain